MKITRLALISAGVGFLIAVIPVVQRLLILPVFLEHGYSPLTYINRLSAVILLPGKAIVYRVSPPPEHYFLTWQLLVASALNFLVYAFAAILLLTSIRRWKQIKRNTAPMPNTEANASAPMPGRRTFLVTAATGTAGFAAIAAGTYPVIVEPNWLKVCRITVKIPDLPAGLNGTTIAQLTDIHHDEWISAHHIRTAVQLANSLNPDLVALTGDYVTSNRKLIRPAVAELANLKSRAGTVAVMGNHDWWSDSGEIRRQFRAHGIPLIDNDRQFLTADRRLVSDMPSDGLCIGGVGDLWEDEVDPEKAFRGVPATMPRLLLSHNPDVAEHGSLASGHHRVDLMLSGHTHGGQVRLPGFGTPIVPSAYGQKYSYGLVQGPAFPVQVSSGIGLALLPVRLNVRPEVVLTTLQSA